MLCFIFRRLCNKRHGHRSNTSRSAPNVVQILFRFCSDFVQIVFRFLSRVREIPLVNQGESAMARRAPLAGGSPELLCARYVRSYVRALLAPGGAQEPKRPPGGRGGRGGPKCPGPQEAAPNSRLCARYVRSYVRAPWS